jgi:hypothetical protein
VPALHFLVFFVFSEALTTKKKRNFGNKKQNFGLKNQNIGQFWSAKPNFGKKTEISFFNVFLFFHGVLGVWALHFHYIFDFLGCL